MSVLTSWLSSPPPDAALEIAADRATAAAVAPRADGSVVSAYASEPLRPGVVTPALLGANVQDRHAVIGTIARLVEKLGTRPRRVALVIPDTAVKVSLLRFDSVPPRRDDFEQLIRWQLRKAAPFPIEAASVTYTAASALPEGGQEFVVELARSEGVREYESLCEDAGLYPGLVENATFSLLGILGDTGGGDGDWLIVHVRPDYTTMVILRNQTVIFYRHRPEDGQDGLPDLVHQTAMYYQDRLSGSTFAKVYLAGAGRAPGVADAARRGVEERLGLAVEPLDLTRAASLADRINPSPELIDALGPAVGLLRRTRREVAA